MDSALVTLTRSRVTKGLIGIPREAAHLFPTEPCRIEVLFDGEDATRTIEYIPYEPRAKERRIYGVGHWFTTQGIRPGDVVRITLEDPERHRYRIASERALREREIRSDLRTTKDLDEGWWLIDELADVRRTRPRALAAAEIYRLLQRDPAPPRSVLTGRASRRAPADQGMRALLGHAYSGKCQLCSYTFAKKNGAPHFEIHHIEPLIGDHPKNLLVVCANCHAKLTFAEVSCPVYQDGWLVEVKINGSRVAIRQQFLASRALVPALIGAALILATHAVRISHGLR